MRRSLFSGRPLSPRKDPCARWPRFPVRAKFRDFPMKFAGFSSKISESCKKNAFLWKVCRPSPWKIKNNSYYWAIWRRTQVGKGRLCKSPIPQFESERCLEKGGWFHPSFRFKFPEKESSAWSGTFSLAERDVSISLALARVDCHLDGFFAFDFHELFGGATVVAFGADHVVAGV